MQNSNGLAIYPRIIQHLDAAWVASIKQKLLHKPSVLRDSSGSSSCCIQRIPPCFRRSNPRAFDPQIISIGPFHHGKERLQAMEEHKWKYLQSILSRSGNECLEECLMAVKELEQAARSCYSETIYLSSNEFVETLVVDALFIIDLLLKSEGLIAIDQSDPIFKIRWIIPRLRTDLLLLENQIPFFILQQLFDLTHVTSHGNISLPHLAVEFFKPTFPSYNQTTEKVIGHASKHLLHLFHSRLLPVPSAIVDKNKAQENSSSKMIFTASELRDAGVEFKKVEASSFLSIRFRKRAIEIPSLSFQDCTQTLLLNLIMFEHCYSGCTAHFSAYVSFMKSIVGSGKDAAILRCRGIIDSTLGGDEEMAQFFKEMGKLASIAPATNESYLQDVIIAVDRYYKTDSRARRARMKKKYCSDPWPILSCFLS